MMKQINLKLVAPDGDIQEHVVTFETTPRMGEWLTWSQKTKVVFDAELDRHVREVDPDWVGSYVVRKVEHDPPKCVVWAHKT
jgi:hypothetical protein